MPFQPPSAIASADALRRAAKRALARCDELALCTERAGEITRTFCSPAMREAQRRVESWMQASGLQVHYDPATNLIGRRAGPDSNTACRRLLIGSHLDSVVNAGRYDGVLGVMLGLALVELLGETGVELPFALDVIGFCEEEGVRFSTPYIGSRALIGELPPELLARRDASGCTMADALRAFGNPERLGEAICRPEDVVAYVEPHIEQGPVLEQEGLPIGVVSGISGQARAGLTFRGRAGHAGTVPMSGRQDALAAAAQWIGEVERIGRTWPGLVATVGRIEVTPNVGNVIPGEARVLLDVRHLDDTVRASAFKEALANAGIICRERGLTHSIDWQQQECSVHCDWRCKQLLDEALNDAGHKPFHLPSGAGHDAAILARRFPVCMLFLRCVGGVSHHPDEAVTEPDVAAALDVLWRFVMKLTNALVEGGKMPGREARR